VDLIVEASAVRYMMRKHTIGDGENIVLDYENSKGSWLVDAVTGKAYLDLASQFASQALGWNDPYLKELEEDMKTVGLHKFANSDYYSTVLANFTHAFAAVAPDFEHFFFIEGGSQGVENAMKAAFDWKAKKMGLNDEAARHLDIIHLEQAFHGRSGYTLSVTNTGPEKTEFFPKFNWTRIVNPKTNGNSGQEVADLENLSLQQAEDALKRGNVAAILLETVQGEGGDNHFRANFFQQLRRLADEYDAMLILDEVQTGLGLTGKMWAYQHYGIVPDMIAFGKKTQVCGFCSTNRIDEVKNNVFKQSSRINSTWGGNNVDMLRFIAISAAIRDRSLVANAAVQGNYLVNELRQLKRISNVRGLGMMIAFDLDNEMGRNNVMDRLKKNCTILPCGEKSIRLRPHLTFSEGNADVAIELIKTALG
jgi:L-lysine 6-transaminase